MRRFSYASGVCPSHLREHHRAAEEFCARYRHGFIVTAARLIHGARQIFVYIYILDSFTRLFLADQHPRDDRPRRNDNSSVCIYQRVRHHPSNLAPLNARENNSRSDMCAYTDEYPMCEETIAYTTPRDGSGPRWDDAVDTGDRSSWPVVLVVVLHACCEINDYENDDKPVASRLVVV